MTRDDIVSYAIRYFTASEIEATGARLPEIQIRLMQHLDRFRSMLGQPVQLVKNGLTSGQHKSQLHKMGVAVDCTVRDFQPEEILKTALECDFKGIGLYCREGAGWVSFHLDLRQDLGLWVGARTRRQRRWDYTSLIAPCGAYLEAV